MSGDERAFDCVVVGGGVAGLSAALVLGRTRRSTLVVDAGAQSNRLAPHVGGLLGHDGTPPAELYALGRDQVAAYDAVQFREGRVADARSDGAEFLVTLEGGDELRSRSLVLATGMSYEVPAVPGFADLWGDSVFHCPFCHGWDVRDRAVAVCSPPELVDRYAGLLAGWTDDISLVDPGEVIAARVEEGTLKGLALRDGSLLPCEAVLVHAPLHRRDDLAERLGLTVTDAGFVEVDAQAHTSLPGVYAAGDLAFAPQQVAVAMGSGHAAGLVATRELLLGREAH
jgi:thioredoxin reductase